jgi:hypothetical protein
MINKSPGAEVSIYAVNVEIIRFISCFEDKIFLFL